jgi:PTS system cellobiose-specific IIC component
VTVGPDEHPQGRRARLAAFADALGREPHLVAVRDGVVAALPLVLIGSLFLLLAQPPSKALQDWLAATHLRDGRSLVQVLVVPQKLLTGLIALYVCFGTARSLARHHGLDEQGVPLLAVASFLVAVGQAPLAGKGWGLDADRLGAGGLFGALLVALGSVHLQRLVGRRLVIRMPAGVPEVIAKSFAAVIPGFATVTSAWLLTHVLGLDLVAGPAHLVAPLVSATDHLGSVLAICVLDSSMWLLGVHPLALMSVLRPIWEQMIVQNQTAFAAREALPHIAPQELFLWFVWQGGSGGTLALALLLLRAKSATLRVVGRVGIVPALFNINEPILFGAPIVMNPRLAVPFVLTPLVTAATAYAAIAAGLVARPALTVLWTLPAPVGAYLTTGGDPRAVVLQLVNLAIAGAIYWPFLRAYDRALYLRELEAKAAEAAEAEASSSRARGEHGEVGPPA